MTINQIRPNISSLQQPNTPGQARSADMPQQARSDGDDVFNAAETEFFASLYPQSATEVRSYATYRKGGEVPPTILGSHIDRKG